MLLQPHWGTVPANFASTSAGMCVSFVANGLLTFGADRLTWRQAGLFLITTGAVMWLLQPVAITLGLHVADALGAAPQARTTLLVVKLGSIGVSLAANFLAYRYVVWPARRADAGVSGAPRP